MKKTLYPVTNLGSVSLLMVFIVLCLTVLSTLSLSGALSEYQYSRKLAQHHADYYRASGSACRMLKEIDRILDLAHTEHPDDYYRAASQELALLEGVEADLTSQSPSITYQIPVDDSQSLQITLALNAPDEPEQGYYRITAWQEIPSSEWNGDDSLNLMTF